MAQSLNEWFNSIGCPPLLAIFIISLFPILELRGGLIVAALAGQKWLPSFLICYLGNILPVPFILLFIKKIFAWMKKWGPTERFVMFFENRAKKKIEKSNGKEGIGRLLFVFWFVAIPLPGTGAWTGALIASFMNMKLKHAIPTICLGVLGAGIIMSIICFAFPSLCQQLFGFTFAS